MFNNEVTYDKKWETQENKEYLKKLHKKYFKRTECRSSCPLAWAKEVHELLENINKEYGFKYCEYDEMGYPYQGSILNDIFILPFRIFITCIPITDGEKSFISNLMKRVKVLSKALQSGILRSLRLSYKKAFNNIFKPKVVLQQVKEKYGNLTIYVRTPNKYIQQHVEDMIKYTEIELAEKGAYYPVESMYYNKSSWYDYEHEWETKIGEFTTRDGKKKKYTDTTHYSYRKILKDKGYDLKILKMKADRRRNEKKG